MEKGKSSKTIIIVVLVIIILGLVGYIAYDKGVFSNKKKEVTSSKKEEKVTFDITYKDEEYLGKNSKGEVIITNKRNIPNIISNKKQDIADKIVSDVKASSDEIWKQMNDQADDKNLLESGDKGLGSSLLYSTAKQTDSYISFKAEQSGGYGGVSWAGTSGAVYSTKTGEKLDLVDLAENETEFKTFINDYTLKYLEKSDYQCLNDDWKSTFNKYLFEDSYNLDDEGLNIYISRYAIACGADGTIIVKVPYNEANSYLKSEYKNK